MLGPRSPQARPGARPYPRGSQPTNSTDYPDTATRTIVESRRDGVRRVIFLDDDSGYLNWIDQNPDGFVLNAYRTPTPSYLMLHRSSCRTITGTPAASGVWTVDYRKACGDRRDLEQWVLEHLDAVAKPCSLCIAAPR